MIDSSPSLIPVHDTYHAHAYLFGKNAFACNDTFAIYIYIIFIYIHIFTILGSTPVTFQDSSKAKKQKTDPYASASSPSEYPLVI